MRWTDLSVSQSLSCTFLVLVAIFNHLIITLLVPPLASWIYVITRFLKSSACVFLVFSAILDHLIVLLLPPCLAGWMVYSFRRGVWGCFCFCFLLLPILTAFATRRMVDRDRCRTVDHPLGCDGVAPRLEACGAALRRKAWRDRALKVGLGSRSTRLRSFLQGRAAQSPSRLLQAATRTPAVGEIVGKERDLHKHILARHVEGALFAPHLSALCS
jgi:hypothetical protein